MSMVIALYGDFDLLYGFYIYIWEKEDWVNLVLLLGKLRIIAWTDIPFCLSSCSRLHYPGNKTTLRNIQKYRKKQLSKLHQISLVSTNIRISAGIGLFYVNNGNTRSMWKSSSGMETVERRQYCCIYLFYLFFI